MCDGMVEWSDPGTLVMCDLSVVGADATDRIFHSYSQLSSITAATCTATATNARSGVGDAKEQQRVAPNYALPAEKAFLFWPATLPVGTEYNTTKIKRKQKHKSCNPFGLDPDVLEASHRVSTRNSIIAHPFLGGPVWSVHQQTVVGPV